LQKTIRQIYHNDQEIIIDSQEESGNKNAVFLTGNENVSELKKLVTAIESDPGKKQLVLLSADPEKTWKTFQSIYIIMEAAGGLVFDKSGRLLMIFRNERWDLPKGKIENNETTEVAALREVSEETGIGMLHIEGECETTFHTYSFKDDKILKRTYWFRMSSADEGKLIPQLEEGITAVKWFTPAEVKKNTEHSYSSIVNILKKEKVI
jgi:ADP-ribose pyrophosphatase YjhB (NUDIX family)